MSGIPGYTSALNSMGVFAIRLHYSADPEHRVNHPDPDVAAKAQEWLTTQKMSYPDPNDAERELEINWFVSKGSRVFPQFSETYHVKELKPLRHRVVYRAWDFGWHSPACIFAQIDSQGRLVLLRESVGAKQTTREFAGDVLKRCAEWFPLHTPGFEDFCDPAGQQVKSIDSDKNERRDVDILEGLGIHPRYEFGWSRKDGRTLIHQLLTLRTDGTPSLYVDSSGCPVVTQSFLGRYVYPESQQGKLKEDPNDDEHPFSDVMASLRYLVTGLHTKLSLTRFKASSLAEKTAPTKYTGYGFRTGRKV